MLFVIHKTQDIYLGSYRDRTRALYITYGIIT